jgi:hypothetical protein
MNGHQQYLRLKKLSGRDIVRVAAKHNLRELQAELGAGSHIDHTRIRLNQVLAGADTAAGVAADAEHLMRDAGVGNLRRDAVRAIEIIVSLSVSSTADLSLFFSDSLDWVNDFFSVPVLSAVIHRDEAAPHCHVLLLPLVDGRMAGSDLVGNRTRLQAIQASFFERVGRRYGLARPKAQKRFNRATKAKAASLIVTAIQGSPELLEREDVGVALMESISHDPAPLLTVLGLSMPTPEKAASTFVGIMTKPCKPEKPIGFKGNGKPIGFARTTPANRQTLSCVGFAPPPSSLDAETCSGEAFTRSRDDLPAEYWDSECGEYRLPPVPPIQTRLG